MPTDEPDDLMCQVRCENVPATDAHTGETVYVSYTCFRPTPCDVPGHEAAGA